MPEEVQLFIADTATAFGNNSGVTPPGAATTLVSSPGVTLGVGIYEVQILFMYTGTVGVADTASNVQFRVLTTLTVSRTKQLIVVPVTNTMSVLMVLKRVSIFAADGNTAFQVQSVAAGTTAIYNAWMGWTQLVN